MLDEMFQRNGFKICHTFGIRISYFISRHFIHKHRPEHLLRKKKKCTVRNEKKKLWVFLFQNYDNFWGVFSWNISWRINLLFLRRSEFFLCCLYLLLLSITLTERDLYLLKADESHLDWLAKKKASLATISKSKKKTILEFLKQRMKYYL